MYISASKKYHFMLGQNTTQNIAPPPTVAKTTREFLLKGKLSTVDLIKVAYFVEKVNNVFNFKSG